MATEAVLVDNAAFARLHEEAPDRQPFEMGGYLYLTRPERGGWVTYRTYGPKWVKVYQARRVLTSPAGGGVLALQVAVATGFAGKLINFYAQGPLTNTTLTINEYDEDTALLGVGSNIGAGATRSAMLPQIGGGSTTNAAAIETNGLTLAPGTFVQAAAAASAQTETLTVGVVIILPITATTASVVWTQTGSAAGATLAASTISAANTLQAVLLP